jgi:alpha-galactosidase
MAITTYARHQLGDTVALYLLNDGNQRMGLVLFPAAKQHELVTRRETLSAESEIRVMPDSGWRPGAWGVDSLVQIKLVGDVYSGGFSGGRTMRNSGSLDSLRFKTQRVEQNGTDTVVISEFEGRDGLVVEHRLRHTIGQQAFSITTSASNRGATTKTLEYLSSASLMGITPFASDDAAGRLRVHRLRTSWSNEGRLETRSVEALDLERSWIGHGVRAERFGQVGSMPVKGWHPFAAVEDTEAGVTWALQVCWGGSWQIELYRQDDTLALSGGQADREFGHWMKQLEPGATFQGPECRVTAVAGGLDEACDRLTAMMVPALAASPAVEAELPIVFNEYCTTWGDPAHEKLLTIADRLRGTPVRYLVIDAGWYKEEGVNWGCGHGDWKPSRILFPEGLKATADAIRTRGLIPGLWFEMETVGWDSKARQDPGLLLHRDGVPMCVGGRFFLDLRKPEVQDRLARLVIGQLRDYGFGYMKVDYNDTIGLGCDGAESQGEGLRQVIEGAYRFWRRIRAELPELVLEMCASGGHRLEPSLLALADMGSFSDAHETREIPIIAANLQRVMPPRQSQIWAVLHPQDDMRRLRYSLTATFLGRMCLSGDIVGLSAPQWALVQEAMQLYRSAAPIIAAGTSRRCGTHDGSAVAGLRHPSGWQGVLRIADNGRHALAVVHSFGPALPAQASLALPGSGWKITGLLAEAAATPQVDGNVLTIPVPGPWTGTVVLLAK